MLEHSAGKPVCRHGIGAVAHGSCKTDLHHCCQVANMKASMAMDCRCCQWAQQLTLRPGTALGSGPPELICNQSLRPLSPKAVTPSMLRKSAIWVPGCSLHSKSQTLDPSRQLQQPTTPCHSSGMSRLRCSLCLRHAWPYLPLVEALAKHLKHPYCAARRWLTRLPRAPLWVPHIRRAAPNSTHSMAHLKTAQSRADWNS